MREIGKYRIEGELGRGGMAVVHLAREHVLDREVALKELAGLWATDPVATARFLREAKLAGSLNHPNILVVLEYFEHEGIPFIAMEYLPLGPLRGLVGRLTDVQVVGALEGILAGLEHAAERGIVHRDLKPENVMRTPNGSVKIADFGIATAYDELASANLTPLGEFVGAPGYVSPEQVLGEEATTASDLYSVGVIAYELLTGAVPFAESGSGGKMLVTKVGGRARHLASARPDVDRRLAEWVDRLLEREPSKRPSTPATARDRLEGIAEAAYGHRWRRDATLPLVDDPGDARGGDIGFVRTAALRTPALARRLLAHALTRPTNVVVPVAVAVAGALLTPWLFLVAVAVYAALVSITFFDGREVQRIAAGHRAAAD